MALRTVVLVVSLAGVVLAMSLTGIVVAMSLAVSKVDAIPPCEMSEHIWAGVKYWACTFIDEDPASDYYEPVTEDDPPAESESTLKPRSDEVWQLTQNREPVRAPEHSDPENEAKDRHWYLPPTENPFKGPHFRPPLRPNEATPPHEPPATGNEDEISHDEKVEDDENVHAIQARSDESGKLNSPLIERPEWAPAESTFTKLVRRKQPIIDWGPKGNPRGGKPNVDWGWRGDPRGGMPNVDWGWKGDPRQGKPNVDWGSKGDPRKGKPDVDWGIRGDPRAGRPEIDTETPRTQWFRTWLKTKPGYGRVNQFLQALALILDGSKPPANVAARDEAAVTEAKPTVLMRRDDEKKRRPGPPTDADADTAAADNDNEDATKEPELRARGKAPSYRPPIFGSYQSWNGFVMAIYTAVKDVKKHIKWEKNKGKPQSDPAPDIHHHHEPRDVAEAAAIDAAEDNATADNATAEQQSQSQDETATPKLASEHHASKRWKPFSHRSDDACLLARPHVGSPRHDLQSCWYKYLRNNDDPKWPFLHCNPNSTHNSTFFRDHLGWGSPLRCSGACDSCMRAATASGAEAAFCYRNVYVDAQCQVGYSPRPMKDLLAGRPDAVCDFTVWPKRCHIRESQVALVNLARVEDDSWRSGHYLSQWEYVDVQPLLDRLEKVEHRNCADTDCITDAGGHEAWRPFPPAAGVPAMKARHEKEMAHRAQLGDNQRGGRPEFNKANTKFSPPIVDDYKEDHSEDNHD